MANERFNSSESGDVRPSANPRVAAEATIRAAFTPEAGNGVPDQEKNFGRKNKKKKRNRNRRERTVIAAGQAEAPGALGRAAGFADKAADKAKEQPKSTPAEKRDEPQKHDEPAAVPRAESGEGALDLATPHEGEINMHDGVIRDVADAKPRTEALEPDPVDAADENLPETASINAQHTDGETPQVTEAVERPRTLTPQEIAIRQAEEAAYAAYAHAYAQAQAQHQQRLPQQPEQAGLPTMPRMPEARPRYQPQPELQHQARDAEASQPEPQPEQDPIQPDGAGHQEFVPPIPPSFHELNQLFPGPQPEAANDVEQVRIENPLYAPAADQQELFSQSSYVPPVEAGRYTSDIPPGMQRSVSELRRVAGGSFLLGWLWGRRGKRKAVAKARAQATQKAIRSVSGRTSAPRTPDQYQQSVPVETATLHRAPAYESVRTTVAPTSVESRTTAPSAEKPRAAERPATIAEAKPAVVPQRNETSRSTRMPEAGQVPRIIEKPVSEMGRSELLKIAKKINIDGVKLSEVYAASRIDQEGLRAVVETYLRGGDIKRQLTEEVVAKEQSFERDPLFRHKRPGSAGRLSAAATAATAGARSALQEQSSQLVASSQKTAKKAGRILMNGAKQAQHEIIDNSNTMDWVSITAIVVVWSLILLLLLR